MAEGYRFIGEWPSVEDALDHCERLGLGDVKLFRGETGLIRGLARIETLQSENVVSSTRAT